MIQLYRRWIFPCVLFIALLTFFNPLENSSWWQPTVPSRHDAFHTRIRWKDVVQRFPVLSLSPLPTGPVASIPKIQHDFEPETTEHRKERLVRQAAVRKSFQHSWKGYRKHAWLQDEVTPLSGTYKNGFGGWGATLVDSLDTLWIMGMKRDFRQAVRSLKHVDFTSSPLATINVFETTIRYLGGLLSAYDVSEGRYPELLDKAVELGDMLYVAFDTPNRMPINHWDWKNGAQGGAQETPKHTLLAELGSLSLEFTRLSQLSGEPKFYDAIQRITTVFEEQQTRTKIPGLWPIMLDTQALDFTKDRTFSFGAMADSHYEYLPKQHLMLGGRNQQYQNMYQSAIAVAKKHLFFRPVNPDNQQLLLAGTLKRMVAIKLTAEGQHLTCFAGGMVALAAKVFNQPHDLETARQLVNGCLWAYESMPSGIMPELFSAVPCKSSECDWSENKWFQAIRDRHSHGEGGLLPLDEHARQVIKQEKLVPGFSEIVDSRYLLRPEAIESVFVLYRITGDQTLQDRAWTMFKAIESHAKTDIAYGSINDVTVQDTEVYDSMESFWTAETLKYFYLIFSEPDVISLDDYVL